MAEPVSKKIASVDEGIEKGVEELTPQKIATVINSVLKGETGAILKVYIDSCVHCGLCSEACHFYLSHDNDPKFSPAGKVKQTIWEILKKNGNVSPAFISRASEICYTECNVCRRCSMYCPLGIDIAYMMLVMRRICYKLGVTPKYIQDTAHSHSATLNQMWVKEGSTTPRLKTEELEKALVDKGS